MGKFDRRKVRQPHATTGRKQPKSDVRGQTLSIRPVDDNLKQLFISRYKELESLVDGLSNLVSTSVAASFVQFTIRLAEASVSQFAYDYSRYMSGGAINHYAAQAIEGTDASHHPLIQQISSLYINVTRLPESVAHQNAQRLISSVYSMLYTEFNTPNGVVSLNDLRGLPQPVHTMVNRCVISGSAHMLSTTLNVYLVLPIASLFMTNLFNIFVLEPLSKQLIHRIFDSRRLSVLNFNGRQDGKYERVDRRLREIRQKRNQLTPIVNGALFLLKNAVLAMLAMYYLTEENYAPIILFYDEENEFWLLTIYIASIVSSLMYHNGYFSRSKRDVTLQTKVHEALIRIFDGILDEEMIEMVETEVPTDTMYCVTMDNIAGFDNLKCNIHAFIVQCKSLFNAYAIDVVENTSGRQLYITYHSKIHAQQDEIHAELIQFIRTYEWKSKPIEDRVEAENHDHQPVSLLSWGFSFFNRSTSTPRRSRRRAKKSPESARHARPAVQPRESIRVNIGDYVYVEAELAQSTMFPLNVGNTATGLSHFGVLSEYICEDNDALRAKFLAQLQQGTRGSRGTTGIRYLKAPADPKYTFEIKVSGTDARCFGREEKYEDNKTLVIFDQFEAHPAQRSGFRR